MAECRTLALRRLWLAFRLRREMRLRRNESPKRSMMIQRGNELVFYNLDTGREPRGRFNLTALR
ncbi:hypothetical protein SAMN05216548_12726 [Faunimonas pinastri]|uniref:Uncharacterized protein n=1 Tax=Faunimonas pinastri TaxID=1855383 RepID=A0A1H9QE55_9HYPH|nr:hypothetical protein [Faunimonas pinastri]SER58816.1 hypothetical protein SAMN05216548_12726 [Faunimonas pinastri]